MHKFYLSLGANLGDREETIKQAVALLGRTEGVRVTAVSSYYETPPWGKTDQPPFINIAAAVESELDGQELLDICLAAETALGRVRHEKWGARRIDIDIVYSPDEQWQTEKLQLPHPYLLDRAFVLVPLQEIAPELRIHGKTLGQWIERLPEAAGIRKRSSGRGECLGKNTDR